MFHRLVEWLKIFLQNIEGSLEIWIINYRLVYEIFLRFCSLVCLPKSCLLKKYKNTILELLYGHVLSKK